MTEYQSSFLREMDARGYIHQCSDHEGLDAAANDGMITAYIGFDCTARSLHVGNLLGIMMLRKLQLAGHKPIVLIGGGTTKVGDPSGKDESRKLLSDEQIAENVEGIRKVFGHFLDFSEDKPNGAIMVNNADWLSNLNYIDFLRDYGPHFTINRMLAFDSVKLRLEREQPLTFLEFNYMIFQAYDYLELSRRQGCTLQMGGSDQWGNIINGIELGRRVDGRSLYALTTALLTTSSGAKMGKSVSGAVWLNEDMLSSYDYWQFWRNTEDADVGRFLRLFTELPLAEIENLAKAEGAKINEAKKILATEATAMAHGREAAEKAARTAQETFEAGAASAGLPTIEIASSELESGLGVLNAFVSAGLAATNGEVRRFIKGGGAKVNDKPLSDPNSLLTRADINTDGAIKLSIGKKRHVLLKTV